MLSHGWHRLVSAAFGGWQFFHRKNKRPLVEGLFLLSNLIMQGGSELIFTIICARV